MTIWKHFWFLWILLVISQMTKSDGAQGEKNREFSSIDITKITKWTQTENVVPFCITVLASQAIITSGWIVLGKIFLFVSKKCHHSLVNVFLMFLKIIFIKKSSNNKIPPDH